MFYEITAQESFLIQGGKFTLGDGMELLGGVIQIGGGVAQFLVGKDPIGGTMAVYGGVSSIRNAFDD